MTGTAYGPNTHQVQKFLDSLKNVPWMKPQGGPSPEWRVFETMSAAQEAAQDTERDATRSAVWNTAWNAARDAERDAAWDAARDAAFQVAWNAARDAAWSAALHADVLVVADLIDKEHLAHAQARMNVWKRGYGLLCDVGGVLYVYRIAK